MAQLNDTHEAIAALERGEVIVMPTDTVYGLAARPDVPGAVAGIFAIKQRPREKPLPVLAAHIDALRDVVEVDERARRLADAFWPGPLTLVLPRATAFTCDLGGSSSRTVGVRVPALDAALELLHRTGPLAVTSANRSGSPPAATMDEARTALGRDVRVFIDGGHVGGAPSTVLELAPRPRVLREGALSREELMAHLS